MERHARFAIVIALALAACGDNLEAGDDTPVDPSAAANFRGYAAVQDDLYATFIAPETSFELFAYLGDSGEELSRLVGRPDGFGVSYDVRNARPNGMNVLVWRMMLKGFSNDLAASCPGSKLARSAPTAISLNTRASQVVGALCAWPSVDDRALRDAWDLVVGLRAPSASRDAWIQYARGVDLSDRVADEALPLLWLGAFLHPAFLLEQ